MTKIFERLFVPSIIQPNAGEAFQIPGDWLTWGDYLDLQIGVNTGGPGNKWSAWFQLISLDGDLASRDLTFDEVKARLSKDGSSNFTLDATMAEPRMSIDGLPVPFILHRGSNDMMAAIEVCDYEAKNLNDAVMLGRTYFNYLNAMFIFKFHVPLKYRLLHIASIDGKEEYSIRTYMPWPSGMPISNGGFEMPAGIASRLLLTYAEGVMSNSQAYRFLCFFKIVDHAFRVGGPNLRRFREENFPSCPWLDLNDVLPREPIERFDKTAVGKTYRQTYDRYFKSDIRNSVAHVLATGDAFEPLDPEEAAHFRAAATLFRFIGQHLIRLISLNAKSLSAAGASGVDLEAAFYPKITSKR